MAFTDYFPVHWTIATDITLLTSALLFVIRVYIIELRQQNGWLDEICSLPQPCHDAVAAEDAWFLASGPEGDSSQASRQLYWLGRVVQVLMLMMLGIAAFLMTGIVSAATSTANLSVSAVVLSRCIVQYVSSPLQASSACSDSTAPTYTVTTPAQAVSMPGTATARITGTTSSTAAASAGEGAPTIVTLTY